MGGTTNNIMVQKITCPKCNSNEVIKWCKRKTENRGLIQRYKCKSCSSYFTIDDGFFRMRNTPEKISQSIDLFYRGVSTRKVQEHLAIFHPHNASNVSIYKWVVKYAKMIGGFTDKLNLNVGEELQVDEMEHHRRKHHTTRGIETNWFIDCIDTSTRFMVSSHFADKRNSKAIKKVVASAKQKTGNKIVICTTDGFNVYDSVVRSVFGYYNLKKGIVIHNKVTQLKGEGFNHPIERLHNNIRARTKVMRGFHGSINSANAILKGFEIYYNFVTKHQAIKKCPYELATDLKLGKNKWLDLIYTSKEEKV